MANYARIVNGVAVDVSATPESDFHPAIAAEFQSVPDTVRAGWKRNAQGEWSAPPAVTPPAPAPDRPQVGPTTFKILWSSPERLKLKELRPSDPVIDDFFDIIEDPRMEYIDLALASTQDGIDYCLQQLVTTGVVAEADMPTRREEILSGTMK